MDLRNFVAKNLQGKKINALLELQTGNICTKNHTTGLRLVRTSEPTRKETKQLSQNVVALLKTSIWIILRASFYLNCSQSTNKISALHIHINAP